MRDSLDIVERIWHSPDRGASPNFADSGGRIRRGILKRSMEPPNEQARTKAARTRDQRSATPPGQLEGKDVAGPGEACLEPGLLRSRSGADGRSRRAEPGRTAFSRGA